MAGGCGALGYKAARNALAQHVDEDNKTTALIQCTGSSYKTQAIFINESGLYSLILSSKLEAARRFKHWVTSEVLPSIRKQGGYMVVRADEGDRRLPGRTVKKKGGCVEMAHPPLIL